MRICLVVNQFLCKKSEQIMVVKYHDKLSFQEYFSFNYNSIRLIYL